MFKSTGTISLHGDDWAIIDVDPEIGRYYLSQFNRSRTVLAGQIMPPKWGPHISVIRGEVVKDKELLKTFDGKKIVFHYSPQVQWDEKHAYLNVSCDEALNMREAVGLPRNPFYDLHLTIGVKIQL
jgi:hypothetical protein